MQELEDHKCSTFSLDAGEKDFQHKYYTGFDGIKMLYRFLDFINPNQQVTFSRKLSYNDQTSIVLWKLRQDFDNIDLAYRIGMSGKHISKVFVNWINVVYFHVSCLKIFPHKDVILDNSPVSFKQKYPDTFLLLDCTEIKIKKIT